MNFHDIKQNLVATAIKLFDYTPKELTGDVDLEDKFDFIGVDIHGAASLTPQEYMEKVNLDYDRDNQSRDYFNSFLTLAIQSGAQLGYELRQGKIDDLTHRCDHLEEIKGMVETERKKLRLNQMPEGSQADEIVKQREEIAELKMKLYNQQKYVDACQRVHAMIEFEKA